jgi:hypothetical protein
MKTKKLITMAVLSIFSLSILLPACSKKEQAKTTRLYTREEAIKEYQTRKNKGTQIPEKDHPNDNRHNLTDINQDYINYNYLWAVIAFSTVAIIGCCVGACTNELCLRVMSFPFIFSTIVILGAVKNT